MDDLTRLALAAAAGDRVALTAFVRQSEPDVWRLCLYLADRDQADDLTQESFLRAIKALPSFRGEAMARTWLLSIARRTCADAVRRATRERRLRSRLDAVRAGGGDGQTDPTDHAGLTELDVLLRGLEPDRRSAFVLTQVLGLSYAEASEVCDCPVGTIRSRVARAREQLVGHLRAEDPGVDRGVDPGHGFG